MKKLLLSLGALAMASMSFAQNNPGWIGMQTQAPALHYPYAMSVVDANTVLFADHALTSATDSKNYVTKTTDGGATWSSIQIAGIGTGTVGDFTAVDANTAWLISSGTVAQNGVWKTTNGGANWTKQTTAAFNTNNTTGQSFANIVYFWDANEGIAVGDPVNGVFEMYKTTNGGTNWAKVATAPAAAGDFGYTHIRFLSGNNIWMGTDTGRILYSPNKGQTWQAFQSPAIDFGGVTTAGSFANLAFTDATHGLLQTNDNEVVGLWKTTDSGANWTEIFPTGNFYGENVGAVPGTGVYVSSSQEGASYSVDGGQTWVDMEFPAGEAPYGGTIQFINSTVGYMGGMSQAQLTAGPVSAIYKFKGQFLAVNDVNASKAKLTIANNPVGDKVELKSTKEIATATVIDMAGKAIKRENAATFNVSNLTKGTYIIQVKYTDGSFENTKMIKK
ncbi:Por secretion system C-terminal sorting domain-containing protein [Soonwooa buanensis]|uniref:Por secretion system C-terminal sorting domain-containing protein n=1 Tax=Soonwooa buanensis TaxID=619805 RepID=A0A1T5EC72_9FLAO|nr:T9SS type A sorting domain-containing protein [Soonwooa buanensis]SKB81476.1 Por secretion system C-terminal sorting domain-containing protein [Soonwooa buanensis]